MQAKQILGQFIEAMRAQDFDLALQYLAKEGFSYVGPNMHFTNPEDMLAFLFGMASIQKDIIVRNLISEGDSVFAAIDYQTYYEPIGDVRIAMWATIRDGLICTLEGFYNAAVVENMLDVNNPTLL
ncbi:MAG TPA: nuclear transport factor 2 family protein [Cellvibrio sp.]|nr:nuclear transport factor 2 family protein [Cellvibrio sp.]